MILASLGLVALSAGIAPAKTQAVIPKDWIKITAGPVLTLAAPPGTYFQTAQGADSFVGTLAGPGFELQLDYGAFSDPLTDKSRFSAYSAKNATIDGKAALVVRGTSLDRRIELVGLHVPNLGQSGRGSSSLTIMGTISDPKEEAVVRQMFGTIQFTSN